MTPWTRLEGTDLWNKARHAYDADPRRIFHGFSHVSRLYHHAAYTYDLPYDPDLDKAILAHDVIYDDKPNKELRSAEWLSMNDPHLSDEAWLHIMRTARHAPGDENRMVLLDLADLGSPDLIESDRERLRVEYRALTGKSDLAFAKDNLAFLTRLQNDFADHAIALHRLPAWEREAFRKIRSGIEIGIDLCAMPLATSLHRQG